MLSSLTNSNISQNRSKLVFQNISFQKSWVLHYLQSLILYKYLLNSGYYKQLKTLNTEDCEKQYSGNGPSITIFAAVRNFLVGRHYSKTNLNHLLVCIKQTKQ
jgi:hypothetical protein